MDPATPSSDADFLLLPPEPDLRGADAIATVKLRQRVRLGGLVASAGPRSWAGGTVFECVIDDGTGTMVLAFLGQRNMPEIRTGRHLWAGGTVGTHRGRRIVLNPIVEMLSTDD